MTEMSAAPRDAKLAYVVAQEVKFAETDLATFTKEEFTSLINEARQKFSLFSDEQLNTEVERDDRKKPCKTRRRRLDVATFESCVVPLDQCSVWEFMGGREWATGPVPRVVSLYGQRSEKEEKFERMVELARLGFYSELPIIVMRRKRNPNQFYIDDGCHRSVAAWLAGIRVAKAIIGVPTKYWEPWDWEGKE